jgi:hypothetical protein
MTAVTGTFQKIKSANKIPSDERGKELNSAIQLILLLLNMIDEVRVIETFP